MIRHIFGGSAGGPIAKDKAFIFGTYERNSDRSTELVSRTVPTPQFLNGAMRYTRRDGSFGTLTDGGGGMLEKWTMIPCDTWNRNLFGTGNLMERYRPFFH